MTSCYAAANTQLVNWSLPLPSRCCNDTIYFTSALLLSEIDIVYRILTTVDLHCLVLTHTQKRTFLRGAAMMVKLKRCFGEKTKVLLWHSVRVYVVTPCNELVFGHIPKASSVAKVIQVSDVICDLPIIIVICCASHNTTLRSKHEE